MGIESFRNLDPSGLANGFTTQRTLLKGEIYMTVGPYARALCAASFFTACLAAQTVSSSLQGIVLDPANALVPNAAVTLSNIDNGSSKSATTDNSGLFRFLDVTPGNYTLNVKLAGFKNLTETNIAMAANETRDLGRLTLELGNATETVSVTAEAPRSSWRAPKRPRRSKGQLSATSP